jgi:hypothetical protein
VSSYAPRRLQKRPNDDLPYVFDFGEWSLTASDALASATVTADVSGLTIGSATIVTGGRKVQVRISAGTAGTTYTLTCQATTTAGYDIVGDGYLELVAP